MDDCAAKRNIIHGSLVSVEDKEGVLDGITVAHIKLVAMIELEVLNLFGCERPVFSKGLDTPYVRELMDCDKVRNQHL